MSRAARPDPPDPTPFSGRAAVDGYAENARRLVPGLDALHRMTGVLLAERAPDDARVLVLGAGGGLELRHLADASPGWQFDGVDPSPEMLALAGRALGPQAARATLHEGLVDVAPEGPFDAATCLLTLHFLDPDERLRTLRELHRRLRPGAPLVVAHHSVAGDAEARETAFGRFAAFAIASGVEPERARGAATALPERLPILDPAADERLLREAGFSAVEQVYAALTFRGWVAHA